MNPEHIFCASLWKFPLAGLSPDLVAVGSVAFPDSDPALEEEEEELPKRGLTASVKTNI